MYKAAEAASGHKEKGIHEPNNIVRAMSKIMRFNLSDIPFDSGE